MEAITFVNLLRDMALVVFAGSFVVFMGLFLFDRGPARKESGEASMDQRERRAA